LLELSRYQELLRELLPAEESKALPGTKGR
jgi:hypothetical protein